MSNNLQKIIIDDEDNKYNDIHNDNNNDINMETNMSFSGIIEIKEKKYDEEKNKKNKNNILDIIEEEHNNIDTNIQKELTNKKTSNISNSVFSSEITGDSETKKEKNINNFEQIREQNSNDKNMTDIKNDNENKIDNNKQKENKFKERSSLDINNNLLKDNTFNNDDSGEIKKNPTVIKKKRKVKVSDENYFK